MCVRLCYLALSELCVRARRKSFLDPIFDTLPGSGYLSAKRWRPRSAACPGGLLPAGFLEHSVPSGVNGARQNMARRVYAQSLLLGPCRSE